MNKYLFLCLFLCVTFISYAQIDSTLFSAIRANDFQQVDSLLHTNIDLHATDEHGANALMWACHDADSALVALLFENGAKPPKEGGGIYFEESTRLGKPNNGWYGSPLAVAAGRGKIDVLRYLLDVQKVAIDEQPIHLTNDSLSEWTALMHAAHRENEGAIIELLSLSNEKLINKTRQTVFDLLEDTTLSNAVQKKDIDKLTRLKKYQRNKILFSDLFYQGKLDGLDSLGKTNLALSLDLYGEKSTYYALSLMDLGSLNIDLVNYSQSKDYYLKAEPIIVSNLGKQHYFYGLLMKEMGVLHDKMGLYIQAIAYIKEALEVTKNTHGLLHEDYCIDLSYLGGIYHKQGDISLAIVTFHEALEIMEKVMDDTSPHLGSCLSFMSGLYRDIGYYDKALLYKERSTEIYKKSLGETHFYYAMSLSNLAGVNRQIGNYDKAESLFLEAKELIAESLGQDHTYYSSIINNLSVLYSNKKNYSKALSFSSESLEKTKKALGENHPIYANRLNSMSNILYHIGEYQQAIETNNKSLAIRKNKLGEQYYESTLNYNLMLKIFWKQKNYKEAAMWSEKLIDNINYNIIKNFYFLPNNIQRANLVSYRNYLNRVNSFFASYENQATDKLFLTNVQHKGLIGFNLRRNDDFLQLDNYPQYLSLKKKISKELSKPIAKRTTQLDSLQNEADKLETYLLAKSKNFRNQNQKVSIESLKNKLQAKEAILDIIHFDYYDVDRRTDTVLYVAYLLALDKKDIQAITLFEEKELQTVLNTEQTVATAIDDLYVARGLTPERKKTDLNNLTFIWKTLLPHLSKYDKLYISASGLLNKVNIGAIALDHENIANDRFEIVQYNNLRSMLAEYDQYPNNDFLLVGGVDYDYTEDRVIPNQKSTETYISTSTAEYTDDAIRGIRSDIGKKWDYLAGTKKEINALEALLQKKDIQYKTLEGKAASETQIKASLSKSTSPRVVHISTHGFFYPNVEKEDEQSAFKASDNPMIRSGLILAEANYAWQKGETPPNREDDGILTAYEVANLNLTDTDLVVLSACETGLGDINGSEGVMGLQRAFKIAGARYIIMSLWKVPDVATQQLMTEFYENWLDKGQDIRTAFQNAQAVMRARYKDKPYSWAGFVLVE